MCVEWECYDVDYVQVVSVRFSDGYDAIVSGFSDVYSYVAFVVCFVDWCAGSSHHVVDDVLWEYLSDVVHPLEAVFSEEHLFAHLSAVGFEFFWFYSPCSGVDYFAVFVEYGCGALEYDEVVVVFGFWFFVYAVWFYIHFCVAVYFPKSSLSAEGCSAVDHPFFAGLSSEDGYEDAVYVLWYELCFVEE